MSVHTRLYVSRHLFFRERWCYDMQRKERMRIKEFIAKNNTPKNRVIGVIVIVLIVAVAAWAINPAKQLERMRNNQRRSDATLILDAIYQYPVDTNSGFPVDLPSVPKEICKTGSNCNGLVDLGVLTSGKKYIPLIPSDPKNTSANGTGYQISKSASGRITVSAIHPEGGVVVSVTQ